MNIVKKLERCNMDILTLCQNINKYSLDEFKKIVSEHQLDIHQYDDLLLYYASKKQKNCLDIALYLIGQGANPLSYDGLWLLEVFSSLEPKWQEYYFYLSLNKIEPVKLNLFDLIRNIDNRIQYFKILVNLNYPISFNRMNCLFSDEYDYLKEVGKLEQYCEQAEFNKDEVHWHSYFYDCDITSVGSNIVKTSSDLLNSLQHYEKFPDSHLFDNKVQSHLIESILSKADYEKLPIKDFNYYCYHDEDDVEKFLLYVVEKFPQYFEYWMSRANPLEWLKFSQPVLDKILNYQDVSFHIDSNQPLAQHSHEKILFFLTHLKLNIKTIERLAMHWNIEFDLCFSIFDKDKDCVILNQFLYLLQTKMIDNSTVLIDIIRQKIEQPQINLHLIHAVQKGDLMLTQHLISQGADIHCENDICLYYAYQNNHIELIQYLYPLSFINENNFSLATNLGDFSIISFYLNSNVDFHIDSFGRLSNHHTYDLMIAFYKEKMLKSLQNSNPSLFNNSLFTSFIISNLDNIEDFHIFVFWVKHLSHHYCNEVVFINIVNIFKSKFKNQEKTLSSLDLYLFYNQISHLILEKQFIQLSEHCLEHDIIEFKEILSTFHYSYHKTVDILHYLLPLTLKYQFFTNNVLRGLFCHGDIAYLRHCNDSLIMISKIIKYIEQPIKSNFDHDKLNLSFKALFQLYIKQYKGETQALEKILYLNLGKHSSFLFELLEIYQEQQRIHLALNSEVFINIKKIKKV
jgi:hypothetical protein